MIKLPDFSKSVEVRQLFSAMGIESFEYSPGVGFIKKGPEGTDTIVSIPIHYTSESLAETPVSLDELTLEGSDDGIIEVNGLKACIYIKDQKVQYIDNGISNYKFHLCWCHTIENMANSGRKSRYVATTRDDGLFLVNCQFDGGHEEKAIKLELCQHCEKILKEKQMYFYPFSLSDFYKKFQTNIACTFPPAASHISGPSYAQDHRKIADKYKIQAGFKCFICKVDCSHNRELLHLHHKDGNGQNNKNYNLMVLCHACHADQSNHQHMKRDLNYKKNKDKINALRKSQGIYFTNKD